MNQALAHRKVLVQVFCPLCGLENESVSHMLFQCDRVCRVWLISPFRLRLEMLTTIQIREFWAYMAVRVTGEGKWERMGLFAVIA